MAPLTLLLQSMFNELVQLQRRVSPLRVLVTVTLEDTETTAWIDKLGKMKGMIVHRSTLDLSQLGISIEPFDALVRVCLQPLIIATGEQNLENPFLEYAHNALLPGALLLTLGSIEGFLSRERWWPSLDLAFTYVEGARLLGVRRCAVTLNEQAATYWSGNLDEQIHLADDLTVALSHSERRDSLLSEASIRRAVHALTTHGVVVIRGLLSTSAVVEAGAAATLDFESCLRILSARGVDLRRPGNGPRIENFYELSMREAFRCDIRHCPAMATISSTLTTRAAMLSDGDGRGCMLRNHPSILRVLSETMGPIGEHAKGNWGCWNFEHGGPDQALSLVTGELGAVVTLPGALDQIIHADTPHIFTHTHLPPHYVNLFAPTLVDSDTRVGQTAFVSGSHCLSASALMMTTEKGEQELMRKLVRPHLTAGDCLLFDCRVLHFGLANSSEHTLRPTLYVNYHRDWFSDPKNFTSDKLF